MRIDCKQKENCCGCSACADACPKQCIKLTQDKDGFRYPEIDLNACVDCGKCLSVCPFHNADRLKETVNNDECFAFVAKDTELIKQSSSGGAFWTIAEAFAEKYGSISIAGAAFDGLNVIHTVVDDIKDASRFKKSKYVQSCADGVYKSVKERLDSGRAVLFSGTPCMVAGLKAFLSKPYDNLLTVDIVCHGVPSQTTFDGYLSELSNAEGFEVDSFTFRIKKNFDSEGVNPRTVDIHFKSGTTHNYDISQCEYLYGFHTGLYFRPSCHNCRFTTPERPGDITLGDFWGIEKEFSELQSKKGVSLVRFNTDYGKEFLQSLMQRGNVYEASYAFACRENDQLLTPSKLHRNREKFIRLRRKGFSVTEAVNVCKKPDNVIQKVFRKLGHIKNKLARKLRK